MAHSGAILRIALCPCLLRPVEDPLWWNSLPDVEEHVCSLDRLREAAATGLSALDRRLDQLSAAGSAACAATVSAATQAASSIA